MKVFKLEEKNEGFIELIKLLKTMKLAESGGHAKQMVEDGMILRDGVIETRKRAKLRPGDKIEVNGITIVIE